MIASDLCDTFGRPCDQRHVRTRYLPTGEPELIMQEIEECAGEYAPRMLRNDQVFEL